MLMMNLEQRPVVFEDIGRQVLATGHRHQPEYYYNKIGKPGWVVTWFLLGYTVRKNGGLLSTPMF